MNLADDSKTLSMMGEATFRQRGEAFYSQLKRNIDWRRWVLAAQLGQQVNPMSYLRMQAQSQLGMLAGQQNAVTCGHLAGLLGSAGRVLGGSL